MDYDENYRESTATVRSNLSYTSTKTMPGKSSYTVYLLDGQPVQIQVDRKSKGRDLFEECCLNLSPPIEEKDYFSLSFDILEHGNMRRTWIDFTKPVARQMINAPNKALAMNVKFYPPDPTQLLEYTRYLFYLQLRDDICKGKMPCNFMAQALLGSYVCQADVGDYTEGMDTDFLYDFPFGPDTSSPELIDKIIELWRSHIGLTTGEAEMNYIENAKKLPMYGTDLYPASDSDNIDIDIGINYSGVLVFRDGVRINRIVWPKILKISYKRDYFFIRVRPAENDRYEKTIGFKMEGYKAAKRVWKICVEHHAFFRLVRPDPRNKKIKFGSKPNLTFQTEYQMKNNPTLRSNYNQTFDRYNTIGSNRTNSLPRSQGREMSSRRAISMEDVLRMPTTPGGQDYVVEPSFEAPPRFDQNLDARSNENLEFSRNYPAHDRDGYKTRIGLMSDREQSPIENQKPKSPEYSGSPKVGRNMADVDVNIRVQSQNGDNVATGDYNAARGKNFGGENEFDLDLRERRLPMDVEMNASLERKNAPYLDPEMNGDLDMRPPSPREIDMDNQEVPKGRFEVELPPSHAAELKDEGHKRKGLMGLIKRRDKSKERPEKEGKEKKSKKKKDKEDQEKQKVDFDRYFETDQTFPPEQGVLEKADFKSSFERLQEQGRMVSMELSNGGANNEFEADNTLNRYHKKYSLDRDQEQSYYNEREGRMSYNEREGRNSYNEREGRNSYNEREGRNSYNEREEQNSYLDRDGRNSYLDRTGQISYNDRDRYHNNTDITFNANINKPQLSSNRHFVEEEVRVDERRKFGLESAPQIETKFDVKEDYPSRQSFVPPMRDNESPKPTIPVKPTGIYDRSALPSRNRGYDISVNKPNLTSEFDQTQQMRTKMDNSYDINYRGVSSNNVNSSNEFGNRGTFSEINDKTNRIESPTNRQSREYDISGSTIGKGRVNEMEQEPPEPTANLAKWKNFQLNDESELRGGGGLYRKNKSPTNGERETEAFKSHRNTDSQISRESLTNSGDLGKPFNISANKDLESTRLSLENVETKDYGVDVNKSSSLAETEKPRNAFSAQLANVKLSNGYVFQEAPKQEENFDLLFEPPKFSRNGDLPAPQSLSYEEARRKFFDTTQVSGKPATSSATTTTSVNSKAPPAVPKKPPPPIAPKPKKVLDDSSWISERKPYEPSSGNNFKQAHSSGGYPPIAAESSEDEMTYPSALISSQGTINLRTADLKSAPPIPDKPKLGAVTVRTEERYYNDPSSDPSYQFDRRVFTQVTKDSKSGSVEPGKLSELFQKELDLKLSGGNDGQGMQGFSYTSGTSQVNIQSETVTKTTRVRGTTYTERNVTANENPRFYSSSYNSQLPGQSFS